jgi:hypothetical protein
VSIISPHKYRDPEINPQIALQKIENNFTNQLLLPSLPPQIALQNIENHFTNQLLPSVPHEP